MWVRVLCELFRDFAAINFFCFFSILVFLGFRLFVWFFFVGFLAAEGEVCVWGLKSLILLEF